LASVESENSLLTQIWNIKRDWDSEWNEWKDINFYRLNCEDLDDRANDYFARLKNMDKAVKSWPIHDYLRDKITLFSQTIPLMNDLRDESMRKRHWHELRINEIKEDFDEESPEFTLEKVYELNLVQHSEKINEITSDAKKQLKIEKSLENIKHIWEEDPSTNLEIAHVRTKTDDSQYYRLQNTDKIFEIIEEHTAELSNMKSSPFYSKFDDKIDLWENIIGQITETIELLWQVQGKW